MMRTVKLSRALLTLSAAAVLAGGGSAAAEVLTAPDHLPAEVEPPTALPAPEAVRLPDWTRRLRPGKNAVTPEHLCNTGWATGTVHVYNEDGGFLAERTWNERRERSEWRTSTGRVIWDSERSRFRNRTFEPVIVVAWC